MKTWNSVYFSPEKQRERSLGRACRAAEITKAEAIQMLVDIVESDDTIEALGGGVRAARIALRACGIGVEESCDA